MVIATLAGCGPYARAPYAPDFPTCRQRPPGTVPRDTAHPLPGSLGCRRPPQGIPTDTVGPGPRPIVTTAAPAPSDSALRQSIEQLRTAIGRWDVTTEFLNADGSVARSAAGTYEFSWVVPDRVVSGRSEIPSLEQASGLLFYINESKRQIEMVAVGADGRLWIMTGPLGGETRHTQPFPTANGGTSQLRFTRYNVSPDAFESRMEYTVDGGTSWIPGNHQTFRRVAGDGS